MSAELYVDFEDVFWYQENTEKIIRRIEGLSTYVQSSDCSFWLCELNKQELGPKDWAFAIRIFLEKNSIFLEISSHPLKVSKDLSCFLNYLRKETVINVRDEGCEEMGW